MQLLLPYFPIEFTSGGGGTSTSGTYEYGWSSNSSSSTTDAVPFNVYWRRRRIQQIILASDLTAANIASGVTFNNFTWHQSSAINSGYSILGFNFKMYHTTASNGSTVATPISGTSAQSCYYNSGEFTPAETTGDKTITFSTGFTWNGTNNICLDTCASQNQQWYQQSGKMRIVTNVTNGLRHHRSDNSGSSCGETPNNTGSYKYSFKMDYS